MQTISPPLSAEGADNYYDEDYQAKSSFFQSLKRVLNGGRERGASADDIGSVFDDKIRGEWRGSLKTELGLPRSVSRKEFRELTRAKHTVTGKQMIRSVKPREKTDRFGNVKTTSSHRAGWDITFSAPKSVSLAALVGGDERVIEAHRKAVDKSLEETAKFVEARMGNIKPSKRTGKCLFAVFLHDMARPDKRSGYAAPDLHSHAFLFNFTKSDDGKYRAVQPYEMFANQKFATAIYRAELARNLKNLGYKIRVDEKTGAPEIEGISRAYIEASSPRQTEIKETAKRLGVENTKRVAHLNRPKKNFNRPKMRERQMEIEKAFGGEAQAAVERTKANEHQVVRVTAFKQQEKISQSVGSAIDEAKTKPERTNWRTIVTASLENGKGEIVFDEVKIEIEARRLKGQLKDFDLEKRITSKPSKKQAALTKTLAAESAVGGEAATDKQPNDELTEEIVKNRDEKIINEKETDEHNKIARRTPARASAVGESREEVRVRELAETADGNAGNSNAERKSNGAEPRTESESDRRQPERFAESDAGQIGQRAFADQSARITESADRTGNEEHGSRILRLDGKPGGGDNTSESTAADPITSDAVVGSNAEVRPTGTDAPESNFADYGTDRRREIGDSGTRTQAGSQQNSVAGGRERELPNRSRSAGSGKPDAQRIIGGGIGESESGGEPDKSAFNPSGLAAGNEYAVQEKPDSQPKAIEMETAPRLEPGADMAQIKIAGAKSAPLRDRRTDDQTARGGQEITGNDREYFSATERNGEKNRIVEAESQRGIDRRATRDGESENKHRPTEHESAASRTVESFGGKSIERSDEQAETLSSQIGEPQITDGERFEDKGFAGSRISDGDQRAAGKRNSSAADSIGKDERADRFGSATNKGGEGVGSFEREQIREKGDGDDYPIEVLNRAADFSDADGRILLRNERGFKREFSSGEKSGEKLKRAADSGAKGEDDNRGQFHKYDNDAAANVPGSRETLQPVAGGADQNHPSGTDANRRSAEKTAQIINIKRFSGALDSQIVAEWTSIIEKSDAADFLNEVVKPKSREAEQQLFGHLDTQAALIAGQLKLPPPEPEAKPNVLKLAVALTKIEVANYKEASGESLSDKVFEVLVKENMRRAAAAPKPEQIKRIRETFGDTAIESTVKPSSDLEAETLNALLDSAKYGFDASAVIQAQLYVNTNEAAAQEAATLVQIAYGGQKDAFTEDFKDDLAEQIYYAPVPAIDVYQDFRQLDWRQTIENFAPTVVNLAEQYKIEIKPPDNDLERNKLLADFVARQLVEAYESQNSPLEKYVQNTMTQSFMQAGSIEVHQSQKDTIAASTDRNLKPPEFSRSLEASAYNLTKYDDEKKVIQAVELADRIREVAQVKAEKEAVLEMREAQVLTMG